MKKLVSALCLAAIIGGIAVVSPSQVVAQKNATQFRNLYLIVKQMPDGSFEVTAATCRDSGGNCLPDATVKPRTLV